MKEGPAGESGSVGDRMYALVERYAELGHHRTGTDVDDATRDLISAELAARGAVVDRVPYTFNRFEASASVIADDGPVHCLPLFYSCTGSSSTATPFVAAVEMLGGIAAVDLHEQRREARGRGADVAVLATGHGEGGLVAENVVPEIDDGPPTVLVAGSEFERVAAGPTRAEIAARLVDGHSETIVARFGSSDAAPVVITTPLTGWFRCAGERATGIAVALETAATLAAEGHSVLFVATTGHELDHLGARTWLAGARVAPRAVLHCGASAAAGRVTDGVCELSEFRIAMTNADPVTLSQFTERLMPVAITAIPGPETWGGEGEEWRQFGVPLLSLTGGFEGFHSPDDLPEAVTTPEALEAVGDAVVAAAGVLVEPATTVA